MWLPCLLDLVLGFLSTFEWMPPAGVSLFMVSGSQARAGLVVPLQRSLSNSEYVTMFL